MTLDYARAEATQELCSALLAAAGKVMDRHGADPNGVAIVGAGFAMAIRKASEHIDPCLQVIVREMLAKP